MKQGMDKGKLRTSVDGAVDESSFVCPTDIM